jgi:hypothetical protein
MSTWRTKLFGDNSMNFFGWLFSSVLVAVVSLVAVLRALRLGAVNSSTDLLLIAIYFVVMGHFCLAQSNYFARVSEKLDAKK